jgi:divalent metal cation (Fe/Co/Zn/Cd) transporter
VSLPAAVSVLVFGVWLVAVSALNFTDAWILIGLIGIAIAITIVTGAFFLGPEAERLGKLAPEHDPTDPEIQRRIRRIFAISRIDLVVLILVVADMVFKPGS